MPASFLDRLDACQKEKQSRLCVGLDPDPARLPSSLLEDHAPAAAALHFNAAIIERVAPFACAFKLNLAFYEALGHEGPRVLDETLQCLPPDTLVIADGKRSDIGNSARFYAAAAFEQHGFDACTVSPYMGADAVRPFLEYEGKCVFVLARTTNPGADVLQELPVEGEPLYLHVARQVARWGEETAGTGGLVAGATTPEALRKLRATCPHLPFLIPGIGAQGGSVQAVLNAVARGPFLVNSSRSILYAYEEKEAPGTGFARAAGAAARRLRDRLRPN